MSTATISTRSDPAHRAPGLHHRPAVRPRIWTPTEMWIMPISEWSSGVSAARTCREIPLVPASDGRKHLWCADSDRASCDLCPGDDAFPGKLIVVPEVARERDGRSR